MSLEQLAWRRQAEEDHTKSNLGKDEERDEEQQEASLLLLKRHDLQVRCKNASVDVHLLEESDDRRKCKIDSTAQVKVNELARRLLKKENKPLEGLQMQEREKDRKKTKRSQVEEENELFDVTQGGSRSARQKQEFGGKMRQDVLGNSGQSKLVASLHGAANEGKVGLVRTLLRCGAQVNAQDEQVSLLSS